MSDVREVEAQVASSTMDAPDVAPATTRTGRPERPGVARRVVQGRAGIFVAQLLVLFAFIAAWQWLPTINALQDASHLFDRFFVSTPVKVVEKLKDILFSAEQSALTWKYIQHTVGAATIGLVIGLVTGGLLGMLIASWNWLAAVFHPFAVAMNAVPRIALIPIVVVIWGSTFSASVIISVIVVFFIAFFNAYEGARSVGPQFIHNARIMGASGLQITWRIRGPYAAAWTLASLPLSATFSVIAVVTGEILTGYEGLGTLITTAQANLDAALTFAVVVLLSIIGLLTVGIATLIRVRILHWWGKGE
jgi:NitT/TauT family transport system permease protein